ncbi:uncharacterized protein LOC110886025 isoform X1 [Helianthus annuus]|uniref:uncharacterized protein LOC110886025 isoform X1 n=1 Tax=Helianthus annuus TaxID=4232 RepID=UPI000B8F2D73|nr:uncharacterized protein LOC110886025 isoform X1 [Helianthus annuus]
MFTEGLDESALNWVKQQGSDKEQLRARSPLRETVVDHEYVIPKSPLSFNSATYKSSNILPPLKFHSSLLGSHNLEANNFNDYEDDDDDDDYGDHDESVGSASDDMDCTFSEGEEFNEEIFNVNFVKSPKQVGPNKSTLNRGIIKDDLSVEVPRKTRSFTETGWHGGASTHLSNYGTPIADLGTPSAPPIFEGVGHIDEVECESSKESSGYSGFEQSQKEINVTENVVNDDKLAHDVKLESSVSESEAVKSMPCGETNLLDLAPYCNSSQNPWQTLITYDACFRLCLNAWARGCTEAPVFLNDECRVLRNAFGLHKFLLQPRGFKPLASSGTENTDKACPLKVKKVIGKIKVEVRKVRIIPQRKLKDTYSQQSAIYVQAGVEYIRHVSSLVKSKINKLGISSFSLPCEEPVTCLLQLKSSQEHTETESTLGICLRPGTGDSHDFFPENQADALLLEVQGEKRIIQGRAVIPVSSLHDNLNDRIKWWPIYHEDNECIGKVQLSITSTVTSDETTHLKCGPVVETLAYDLLLESAMRAQSFHARNLCVVEPWKWLLTEFSDYYGVSESYTKLRHLSHVMNVATPIKDCLELIYELLVPVVKARTERRLTRQEKSLLLDCETQIESLLALAFQNYKSLDESCSTGLSDKLSPLPESAAPALVPAVQLYTLIHDILSPDGQALLTNYLQAAARKRCRKHMVDTDEFVASNTDGFLMDSIAITTAYLKMKNLCINLSDEIKTDIKIHNQHILPSSIDLSSITAAVYSSELCKRLKGFLAAWPPSSPQPHVNELLIAAADFERNLESWNISVPQGGVDSRNLYHNYIMVWVQDMQLCLLDLCKAEKAPWAGVITNYSTSPFAEEVYDKIKAMLSEYEVVISRWPQYTLVLENAVANVERAIMKALERQYADILTPLKDSIPKRLGIQVQKLTRRQSNALYSIPNQLGTFLNTIKRILDVLHCRIEDKLKSWASYLPVNNGDKKSTYGEQMNAVTVLFRTKYKNYMQAVVVKLISNTQASRSTRLQRILEETKEADGESEIRDRMQVLCSHLVESISNLHEVFTNQIFIASCRGLWDKMGQIVLKFLEGRKENRVWYNGSYYALGILDDTFASQMQRLQGNALQEKDLEPPRSIVEARSILCRDTNNAADTSTYFY